MTKKEKEKPSKPDFFMLFDLCEFKDLTKNVEQKKQTLNNL